MLREKRVKKWSFLSLCLPVVLAACDINTKDASKADTSSKSKGNVNDANRPALPANTKFELVSKEDSEKYARDLFVHVLNEARLPPGKRNCIVEAANLERALEMLSHARDEDLSDFGASKSRPSKQLYVTFKVNESKTKGDWVVIESMTTAGVCQWIAIKLGVIETEPFVVLQKSKQEQQNKGLNQEQM